MTENQTDLHPTKEKQDKGMASHAPPQPSLLPAVRAVSDA